MDLFSLCKYFSQSSRIIIFLSRTDAKFETIQAFILFLSLFLTISGDITKYFPKNALFFLLKTMVDRFYHLLYNIIIKKCPGYISTVNQPAMPHSLIRTIAIHQYRLNIQ